MAIETDSNAREFAARLTRQTGERRRARRLAVLAGLSAAVLAVGVPADARAPAGAAADGDVVYSLWTARSGPKQTGWIEVSAFAAQAGRALTSRVTSRPKRDHSPAWSPNGRAVAFARAGATAAATGVYVVSGSGGTPRKIANVDRKNATALGPLHWSPKGDRIVYDRYRAVECHGTKPFDLRFDVSRADGHGTKTIHALPRPRVQVQLGDIEWSADGRKLLYIVYELDNLGVDPKECRWHSPESTLYAINADGSGRTRLAHGEIQAAAWSPSSTRVAYLDCAEIDDETGCDLHVKSIPSGTPSLLWGDELGPYSGVAWSPLGDEVLVAGYRGLYGASVDDRSTRTIVSWPESDDPGEILGFSSDGSRVALISSYRYGGDDYADGATIRIVPLQGGTATAATLPRSRGRGHLTGLSVWLR